jgi:hypothetical protein
MPIPDDLDRRLRTAAFIEVRRMLELRDPLTARIATILRLAELRLLHWTSLDCPIALYLGDVGRNYWLT